MEDLSQYSDEELERELSSAKASLSGGGQPVWQDAAGRSALDDVAAKSVGDMSLEELESELAGLRGEGTVGQPSVGAEREVVPSASRQPQQAIDEPSVLGDAVSEGLRGAGRAVKAIGKGFVGLASGAARLAGTPIRALTGWDGLHRLADTIDNGYDNWGADTLASEYGFDQDTNIGTIGEKIAGLSGTLGSLALGGGVANAAKLPVAVRAGGAALQKSLPWMFGNDAAVRTYDTAKQTAEANGEDFNRARALGLASVNGAIHYFGFKLFENQSLNRMLGMPQAAELAMPGFADAAREGGAKTFSGIVDGVRNGLVKHVVAERAKGALKAGGIMGVQNFLSSLPQQAAEGRDIDWYEALKAGAEGVEEGAFMEGLMGGAAILRSKAAARKFTADKYFRNGYTASNGEHVPGLLHSKEGREFVMKQNPAEQQRILDIVSHGGKVSGAELDAACLPPDMKPDELKEFVKDWRKDLADEWDRAAEPEALGDNEELEGNDDVIPREQQMRNRAKVNEARDHERRLAEAEEDAQRVAAEEAKYREANERADAERQAEAEGAEQLVREEAYRRTEAPQDATGTRGAEGAADVPPASPDAPQGAETALGEAQAEPPPPEVVDRPNRLRRQQPNNFRHPGDNRLRPAVPDINQQPIRETNDETRNGADEASAQPEQGAERPGTVEAPRPEAGVEPGAQAPDTGVVEPSKTIENLREASDKASQALQDAESRLSKWLKDHPRQETENGRVSYGNGGTVREFRELEAAVEAAREKSESAEVEYRKAQRAENAEREKVEEHKKSEAKKRREEERKKWRDENPVTAQLEDLEKNILLPAENELEDLFDSDASTNEQKAEAYRKVREAQKVVDDFKNQHKEELEQEAANRKARENANGESVEPISAKKMRAMNYENVIALPDSWQKYSELQSRLMRTGDKVGVSVESPAGKQIKAEMERMDADGWGELYRAHMKWAGADKKTRGEHPPDTLEAFKEWQAAKSSAPTVPTEQKSETQTAEKLRDAMKGDNVLKKIDAAYKKAKTDAERNALKERFATRVAELRKQLEKAAETNRLRNAAGEDPLAARGQGARKEGSATAAPSAGNEAPRRLYTKDRVTFKNPIVGKTGAKVTGYVWPNKGLEYTDKNGNDRVKRISDWDFGETSEDTGRQIIHQFTVEMPDGSLRTVSAESAAKLLGISVGEVKGDALKQIRYAMAIASMPEVQKAAFERKSKASGFLKPDDSVALMKDGNLRMLGWRGKEDGVTDRWHWIVTTITPDGKIKTNRLATEPKTKGFRLDSSDILLENVASQATSKNDADTSNSDVAALTAKAQALAKEYAELPDREKVSAKGRDLEQRIAEAWDAVDAAEMAENAPVAAPKKTGATMPTKAAKPAEDRKSASGATPAAPTPEMRRKATAAMRILGADAGKDAAALETELRRMEERGQAASGPGRRKAEALRDLAAYKRAVGTKEVSAEEIAEGRQRDAEQRIIEGNGDTLPSEDFYGRRQSRGKGEMPAKWTDAAKKPLERVARALRNVVTIGGKKLKVTFADKPADADGQTRRSIGGIFTGTAADYANRSRQGGVDDGPSVKKIGTGEGTQVYGWGLYGSSERGVAEGYARPNHLTPEGLASSTLHQYSNDRDAAIAHLQKYVDSGRLSFRALTKEEIARTKGAIEILKSHAEKSGHLYEQTFFTDRAPGDESHLLKRYEDLPKEQVDWIAQEFAKEGFFVASFSKLKGWTILDRTSGKKMSIWDKRESGEAYEAIAKFLGSPQAASEFLYRAGIDGIKYPVDSYGGKGVKDGDKAGWNYVAFSDEHIRVDHKWTDGQQRYMRNGDGEVVGEYDADKGEIRLYPGATVADVVHEFTHPLVDFARAEAKAGRGELLGKIKEIIDAERATWEEPVREAYADKGEGEILEEIFTHAMGDKGATLFGKATTTLEGRRWYNRLWDAIKGVWQDFATKMGWNKADLRGLDGMSPEDAAQKILSEMAKGRSFGDAVTGGNGARNAIEGSPSAGSQGGARISPVEDAAYMDAVRRGDMDAAQRMVREAAARAPADVEIDGLYRYYVADRPLGIGNMPAGGILARHDFQNGAKVDGSARTMWGVIVTDKPIPLEEMRSKELISLPDTVEAARRAKLSDNDKFQEEDWDNLPAVPKFKSIRERNEHRDEVASAERKRADAIRDWLEYSDDMLLFQDANGAIAIVSTDKWYGDSKGWRISYINKMKVDNAIEDVPMYHDNSFPTKEAAVLELDKNGIGGYRFIAGNSIPDRRLKSADPVTYDDAGNVIPLSQRFNPQREDIRYSRHITPHNVPPAPTNQDIQDYLGGKDGFMRKLRRMFQDKNIVIRDAEERLGVTDKDASTYYAKDRAFGKNEHELTVLQKREVEPIVEKIHKSGGSLDLFSAYLYARHSGERNAALKASKGVENGSGMTADQADTIFRTVDRLGLRAAFEDAARDVWAMNRKYLQRRVDSGRMTQADYDFYTQKYKHYVPLRTDMTDEELDIFNSTTGGWKRNELMAAQGRKSAADDPLAFSIVQNEQAIRASNANEVRRRFAGLVRRSKGALGEVVDGVNKGGAKWSFTFGDGETVETGSPMRLASERDDIVLFKENGQLKAVKVAPGEHGRGLDLARAVTDKDVVQFNRHLEWIPRATRWMSAMRTQYVPTFIIRNMKADNLEVMLNALSERGVKDGAKFFGKFLKNEVSVAKGVKEYFKTGKSSDRFVQEAVENGLLTGGGMSAEGFTETARRLSDTLQALRERPKILGGAFKAAKDTISLLNACAEYNTRMGVYKTLREEGMSVADAVSYARDVTVNFNRKGYLTPYTNAAFMFSNAAIQGMGRAFKSMNSAHGKEVLAGMFLVGVAQALLDDWLGHDDESEKSGGADSRNLTEYDKSHSLGVALPTGHRVKTGIRNPWALPMYAGRKAVELLKGISSGEKVMKDLASEVGQFVTEPVGGNGFDSTSEFLQTLAPTIIDPFVQWGTGKDYRGQDRLKKSFDKYAPDSWNGKDSTPEAYKAVAKALNFISGGSEHRKGAFDVAPENVRLLTETVFGGVLTDLNNLVKGGEHAVDAVRGKPAAQIARDIPFVRDTFTNMPDNTSRFYAALDAYNADKAEFKKTTELGRRRDMKREKPYLTQGKGRVDTLIDRVKELRHLERGEVKSGQKWVERKTPVPEERKRRFREQRLATQARVLKMLGE